MNESAFASLTAGFAGREVGDLDERLAWIMSFRTVFNAPAPTLWLGSVVTAELDDKETHLVCMRPRCDSVRLDDVTSFLFLPLVQQRKGKEQLVVRVGMRYLRLQIALDSSGWVRREFEPTSSDRAVTATKDESCGAFFFTDKCGRRFTWQGELKAEHAHRVAQAFATSLSRVAVDESEWLRRTVKRGS